MNSLRFLRGATCFVQTGTGPRDRIFFRITARQNDRIRLKELLGVEVDGKWIPGEIKPDGECIWRKVKNVSGAEYGAPYQVGPMSGWIRLYRKPKGGKRVGAGRPKGKGRGRVQQSRSLCLSAEDWDLFDALRGKLPRGKFIRKLLMDTQLRKV